MPKNQIFVALFLIGALSPLGFAQRDQESTKSMPMGNQSMMGKKSQQGSNMGMMGQSQTRQGMQANRDGGCAPMCQMMMEREMKRAPYFIGVGSLFGIFLLAALVLLVLLEIQWVRLWSRRLKAEKKSQP